MKLYFKKIGQGKPLIILHGLFGLSDNWATLSKSFAEKDFACYLIDQRNHGKSPHSFDFNFGIMADDIRELMDDESVETADFIGHSMGGKVAMFFAMKFPERSSKLIVADIAPRYYEQHHQSIFSALHSIDLKSITSRKEAEEKLRSALNEEATIQFLLKNLYWKTDTQLDWRFGFQEIEKNIEEMGKALPPGTKINTPTLFIRGERSGYINENDQKEIRQIFSDVRIETVPNAGHWVHAENPSGFLEKALGFLT